MRWKMDWPARVAGFLLALAAACGAPPAAPTPLPEPGITAPPAPTVFVAPSATAAPPSPPPATPTPTPVARLVEVRGPAGLDLSAALTDAAARHGWTLAVVDAASAETLTDAAVILVNGEPAGLDVCALAARQPAAAVITLGAAACASWPANLLALGGPETREDQAGFLAGMAAGLATTTERVAVLADISTPAGLKYRNGFLSGVRYTCAQCRLDTIDLLDTQAVDFAAAEAARYAALGADVLLAAAGPAGDAALRAAAAAGSWVAGGGADVYVAVFEAGAAPQAERVLVSGYLDPAGAVAWALDEIAAGRPPSGAQPLALANGGVALAPWRADPAGPLSALDLQDLALAQGRLAARALETGVDPRTGLER